MRTWALVPHGSVAQRSHLLPRKSPSQAAEPRATQPACSICPPLFPKESFRAFKPRSQTHDREAKDTPWNVPQIKQERMGPQTER